MSREGALWIGGLEPYMDEDFIRESLVIMGETQVVSIKVMKNKFSSVSASYGFINFDSDTSAISAMHKLNGKIIPNTQPPIRFKLNHQSTRMNPGEKDHSIWVGDLTPEVDDYQLYKFFSARFQSIKSAKVVLDPNGFSKGYGFVRFGNEQEQETALHSMQGIAGLGSKPLKVKEKVMFTQRSGTSSSNPAAPSTGLTDSLPPSALALVVSNASGNPKAGMAVVQEAQAQAWQAYSEQYWSQYASWSQYNQQGGYGDPNAAGQTGYPPHAGDAGGHGGPDYSVPPPPLPAIKIDKSGPEWYGYHSSIFEGDELDLEEHSLPIELEKENEQYMKRSEDMWTALEESFWIDTAQLEENSSKSGQEKNKEN